MARNNKYPGVYARWNTLWIRYTDDTGKQVRESTELPVGQERQAYAMLKEIKARIKASARIAEEAGVDGPVSLETYALRWAAKRKERGIASARDDETRFKMHVVPYRVDHLPLGNLPIDDVMPVHIRDLVRDLAAVTDPAKKLAPRTIRNIYGMLHTMFVDAKVEGLIVSNPCELPRDSLPKRRDSDPTWRASAVFTPSEVESLISSDKIAHDSRVLNALKFLTGARWGEVVALRWRHYDPQWMGGPLGRLLVAESYQWQTNTIKATKTEVPRWVPVHATLARVLAEWKLGGWTEMMGRPPRPDDFIVPPVPWRKQKTNLCRPPQSGLRAFHDDCKAVDIRTRRNHDSRRTFISLARAGGARLDLLTWITHGPSASIMDAYTTVPWSTLCEQVDAIKIRLLEGKVLQLPIAAVGGTREGTRGGKSATMTEDSGCALQDSNLSERL